METFNKYSVLVVDDDQATLALFCEMFEDSPFKIIPTANGREAIEMLKIQPCALAFIDLFMPEVDGLQTLTALKEIQPDLTAVMISGFRNEHLLEGAIKLGAYDYLYKPLDRHDLLSVMLRCLQRLEVRNNVGVPN
jgi:DNA-binding NtrC family response regulator